MKQWYVRDPYTGADEDFETEEEALACAEEILNGHREEAASNGEWPPETELISVYKLAHSARVTDSGITELGEWAEYGMRPAT